MTVQFALTQVADAIREKTRETGPMGLASMPEKIRSIAEPQPCKAVNFWDCDGTCLASYTLEQAAALSELPPLPHQPDLVCQGWNWTLSEIKALNRPVEVGAIYGTQNNRTRLFLRTDAALRREVPLYLGQSVDRGVTVHWGDGSPGETLEGTGDLTISHVYETLGEYVIELETAEKCVLSLGHGSAATALVGGAMPGYRNMLKKAQIGQGVSAISAYAFAYCCDLREITLPASVAELGANTFLGCYAMPHINLPHGVEELDLALFTRCYSLKRLSLPPSILRVKNNVFYYCYGLERVTLPDGTVELGNYAFSTCIALGELSLPHRMENVGSSAFYGCVSLKRVTLPTGITSLASNLFYTSYSLAELEIPDTVTSLAGNACNGCQALSQLYIPAGVTSIGGSAFSGCLFMKEYHFAAKTPPVLAKSNAFDGMPADCTIYVPAGCLEAYQTAANWSVHANQMAESPQ